MKVPASVKDTLCVHGLELVVDMAMPNFGQSSRRLGRADERMANFLGPGSGIELGPEPC